MIICQDMVHSVEVEHTGPNDSAGKTITSVFSTELIDCCDPISDVHWCRPEDVSKLCVHCQAG